MWEESCMGRFLGNRLMDLESLAYLHRPARRIYIIHDVTVSSAVARLCDTECVCVCVRACSQVKHCT